MTVLFVTLSQAPTPVPVSGKPISKKLLGTDDSVLGKVGGWAKVAKKKKKLEIIVILFQYALNFNMLLRYISVSEGRH
jgi:hypothetical protein